MTVIVSIKKDGHKDAFIVTCIYLQSFLPNCVETSLLIVSNKVLFQKGNHTFVRSSFNYNFPNYIPMFTPSFDKLTSMWVENKLFILILISAKNLFGK